MGKTAKNKTLYDITTGSGRQHETNPPMNENKK